MSMRLAAGNALVQENSQDQRFEKTTENGYTRNSQSGFGKA
ncbi:hypothetical protein [Mesorhizobium onobrychidis]|nr:hypothetical protein [Mesorhizobium onobrychidis]